MMDDEEAAAILGDDGLDEFFGNGELSPTFFENDALLLSPNTGTGADSAGLLSPSITTSESWAAVQPAQPPSQTIVQQISQTGAITVQHTAPNGGTTHVVVAPQYQVGHTDSVAYQGSDVPSVCLNPDNGQQTMIQSSANLPPNYLTQLGIHLQQPAVQQTVGKIVNDPQQLHHGSLVSNEISSTQNIVSQSYAMAQHLETSVKKKKTKKSKSAKNLESSKFSPSLNLSRASSLKTIAQPPTPPAPLHAHTMTESQPVGVGHPQQALTASSSLSIQPQPYQLGQALPPGQQLMIVNSQGQLQPLTQEQLAAVKMQQALVQQPTLLQTSLAHSGQQNSAPISVGAQPVSQSSSASNNIGTENPQQTLSTLSMQHVPTVQLQQPMSLTGHSAIGTQLPQQVLQASQGTSIPNQIQQGVIPQQQIIQTINGQQVLIQAPQVNPSNSASTGQQLIRSTGPFVQTASQYVPGPNNTYINIGCQLISLSGVRPSIQGSGATSSLTGVTTTASTTSGVTTISQDPKIHIQIPTGGQPGTRIVLGPGGQAMAVQSQNVIQMPNGQQFLLPQSNNVQGNAVQSFLLPNGQQIVLPQQNQSMVAGQQALVQGQQTVQYLRQPNGQLIPIGVAPPMAASSGSTTQSTVSSSQVSNASSSSKNTSCLTSVEAKSQKLVPPSLLPASTVNATYLATPSSVTLTSSNSPLLPTVVPQMGQTINTVPPCNSTQKMTVNPSITQSKTQFQTIQLSFENHQRLTKIQEEIKKLQSHKSGEKQAKQLQQLQLEQQRILSEGKQIEIVTPESNGRNKFSRISNATPTNSGSTGPQVVSSNQNAQYVHQSQSQAVVIQPQTVANSNTKITTVSPASTSVSQSIVTTTISSSAPVVRPVSAAISMIPKVPVSVPTTSVRPATITVPLPHETQKKLQKLPPEQQQQVLQQLVAAHCKKQSQISSIAQIDKKPSIIKPPVFSAQLKKDQSDLINNPDIKTPFRSFRDIAERLAKYHVYQSYEPNADHRESVDRVFETVSKNLLTKAENMMERFRYVAMRGSMREYSASESVMIQRMWLEKEKREMMEDRKSAEEDPVGYYDSISSSAWEELRKKVKERESDKQDEIKPALEEDDVIVLQKEENDEKLKNKPSLPENYKKEKCKRGFGATSGAGDKRIKIISDESYKSIPRNETASSSIIVSDSFAQIPSGLDISTSLNASTPVSENISQLPKSIENNADSGTWDSDVESSSHNEGVTIDNAESTKLATVTHVNFEENPTLPNDEVVSSTSTPWVGSNPSSDENFCETLNSTRDSHMESSSAADAILQQMEPALEDRFLSEQTDEITSLLDETAEASAWVDANNRETDSPDNVWTSETQEVHSYDDEVDAAIKNILL